MPHQSPQGDDDWGEASAPAVSAAPRLPPAPGGRTPLTPPSSSSNGADDWGTVSSPPVSLHQVTLPKSNVVSNSLSPNAGGVRKSAVKPAQSIPPVANDPVSEVFRRQQAMQGGRFTTLQYNEGNQPHLDVE